MGIRHKKTGYREPVFLFNGGERGIRTLDGLLTHTPLAGERLQPLGHLSKCDEQAGNYTIPNDCSSILMKRA